MFVHLRCTPPSPDVTIYPTIVSSVVFSVAKAANLGRCEDSARVSTSRARCRVPRHRTSRCRPPSFSSPSVCVAATSKGGCCEDPARRPSRISVHCLKLVTRRILVLGIGASKASIPDRSQDAVVYSVGFLGPSFRRFWCSKSRFRGRESE